ncbi:hypothetical protein M433DRAFT_518707 [Acidomyces richmondensis BFW]|nr:MAG: hypothetical protein FE78DRAFT_324919 [Acidomyces sp. 'richmondensis']KYG47101.1 hypothetical protein M433DRAFT_518707 [Acidomyces richmondensis BFW]
MAFHRILAPRTNGMPFILSIHCNMEAFECTNFSSSSIHMTPNGSCLSLPDVLAREGRQLDRPMFVISPPGAAVVAAFYCTSLYLSIPPSLHPSIPPPLHPSIPPFLHITPTRATRATRHVLRSCPALGCLRPMSETLMFMQKRKPADNFHAGCRTAGL